jgi:hypothetical protein
MSNIYEREFLLKEAGLNATGFSEKQINRLATAKAPKTILNIEANHLTRTSIRNHPHPIVPLLEYQLWLEAGKMRQHYRSEKNDPQVNFNSNMWRNFRSSCGFDTTRKGNVSESISLLYPINIPPASKVGDNTLSSFYKQNKKRYFKNDKTFDLALAKVDRDDNLGKFLRLKSEMRNPPIDLNGNILPPSSFKKYPSIEFQKNYDVSEVASKANFAFNDNHQSSGNINLPFNNNKPFSPTKISYRETHPDYDRVILEQHVKGNGEI